MSERRKDAAPAGTRGDGVGRDIMDACSQVLRRAGGPDVSLGLRSGRPAPSAARTGRTSGRQAGPARVLGVDRCAERVDRIGADEVDRAAAEPRPGHPCPDDAGDGRRDLDEGVELGRADLEASRSERGSPRTPPDGREIAGLEGGDGRPDPRVLGRRRVGARRATSGRGGRAPPRAARASRRAGADRRVDVARAPRPPRRTRRAGRCTRSRRGPRRPRVADHERDVLGQRDRPPARATGSRAAARAGRRRTTTANWSISPHWTPT